MQSHFKSFRDIIIGNNLTCTTLGYLAGGCSIGFGGGVEMSSREFRYGIMSFVEIL